jgi:hypothetical protein
MALISPTLPTTGEFNTTADPKLLDALTQILALVNGNLDAANLAAGAIEGSELAESVARMIGISRAGITRRGISAILAEGNRNTGVFGDLSNGPDRIENVTVGPNELLVIAARFMWRSGDGTDAKVRITVGADDLMPAQHGASLEASTASLTYVLGGTTWSGGVGSLAGIAGTPGGEPAPMTPAVFAAELPVIVEPGTYTIKLVFNGNVLAINRRLVAFTRAFV